MHRREGGPVVVVQNFLTPSCEWSKKEMKGRVRVNPTEKSKHGRLWFVMFRAQHHAELDCQDGSLPVRGGYRPTFVWEASKWLAEGKRKGRHRPGSVGGRVKR